jgi:hypothetical protein
LLLGVVGVQAKEAALLRAVLAFKKLRHLIGPRVLVISWLITIQFVK